MAITINGSGTITGISAGGLPDGIVDTDMLATNAVATAKIADDAVTDVKIGSNTFVSYAVIADVKTSGTFGGTATSGSWQTRDLNTEIFDPDGIVSISSNQFTLSAGSYLIIAQPTACGVNAHVSRLYDVTGSAEVQLGTTMHADDAHYENSQSLVIARVSPTADNTYRIETRVNSTRSTYGYGNTSTFSSNMFTIVQIYKEA